jgi:hypothetical protein
MYLIMKSIIHATILILLISFTTPLKSQTYCASKGVSPWEQWIGRVSLAPANVGNNSIKEGYGNFTALTGFTVKRGQNNLFTIDPQASWNNDPRNANIFWRVWIDYNGDGDFMDVGEQVISRQVVFTQGIFLDNESNFIVPTTARLGNTRLRVAMKVGGYPEPCETFDRGEVEDYTVNITEPINSSCRFQDSLQLVSLYNATNPSTWLNKWHLNTPLNTWFGVSLNAEGCVTSVNLENNTMVGANLPTLNMPHLEFLNLRNNVLSGTIPNVNCPNLTGLLLAANQFTGTIPNYNCPNMQNLFLYGNQLTGTIPHFNYPNIVKLLLDSNQLTGTIPPFNAPFMNHFAVSFNKLTGSIPDFNFPVIDQLYLDGNQLSGCLPVSFKAFCGKRVNIANNPGLATQDFNAFCINNTGSCTPPNQPDLTVEMISAVNNNYGPTAYSEIALNWRVKTTQDIPASAQVQLDIFISPDANIANAQLILSVVYSGAELKATQPHEDNRTFTNPTGVPLPSLIRNVLNGINYAFVKIDVDNQIAEANEGNNISNLVAFNYLRIDCFSKAIEPWQEWISRVQFNTIDNASDKTRYGNGIFIADGYSYFKDIKTTVERGKTYPLSITPALSWSGRNANLHYRAWIDFNGNGVFDDAGETILQQNTGNNTATQSVNIPTNARLGTFTMRVSMKGGGYPTPCETFQFGEVEDYTIHILEQSTVGNDTLRLVRITGATTVHQGEKITLNVTIKNTGITPSSPSTPLSIYQNQQPFIFRGPPPTFLTIVSDRTPIGRVIQPNETVTVPVTFTVFPNFSHITRPDYSGVAYNGTYIVLGNRADGVVFNLNFNPVLDTLTVPYPINAVLDNSDLAINIIATDTTYRAEGKHSFTVKVTNNGQIPVKDVIAKVGIATSDFSTGFFTTPTITPQRGTITYATIFGSGTTILWNIGTLMPNESLTALVEHEKFDIPVVLPEFIHEVKVGSNQIIDNVAANDIAKQRFVLDTTSAINYCRSKGTAPWELWISRVQFETINNASDKFKDFNTLGYSNYTNLSTTITRGMTSVLTVTPGLSWTGHLPNVYCRAWIDYNGNKIFEASELVFQNSNVTPFTGAIRVPNALATTTRLRVALKWGSYPEPCETFDRGEVEDYTINFQTGTALVGTQSILELDARAELENAQLIWVSNQSDVDYFEIYKADAQGILKKIGVQNSISQGVFQDNLQTYYFKNASNTEGVYLYQIKAIKYNGSSQLSAIKSLTINDFNSVKVFPNPVMNELSIVLKNYEDKDAKILFYNSLGQIVKTIFITQTKETLVKTEVGNLPTGQYYVRVVAKGKRDAVQRFSIVR